MTATLAPAPGTHAVAGPGASGSVPVDRVLERSVPTAVALRLTVVVIGLLVVATGDGELGAGILATAALLLGHAGALTLGTRRRSGTPVDVRLTRGTTISVLAVLLSGGWWSPFGAVLAIDLALTGLARGYRRAFVAAVALTLLLTVLVPLTAPLAPSTATTSLPVLLVLAAALGGFAHGLAAAHDHDGLGHALHLADANRLAADLSVTLRSLPTAPDAVTISRAALDWLRCRVPFVAAAIVTRDGDGATVVHVEGGRVDDAGALLDAAPATTTVSDTSLLSGCAEATVRVPLELRGQHLGLLVLELEDAETAFSVEVCTAVATLADPLALALDTSRWFARLSTLAGELERSRLASDLSERLCQSMATTAFALDRAAVRTGDVELFRVADEVRADVADLRRAVDDLRADVDDDPDLAVVVTACVERAGDRSGVLVSAGVDVVERAPRVVEQQVLRALQELLAALRDATVADVTWRSGAGAVELAVRHDGRLDVPPSVHDRADAIGASLSTTTVPGGGVLTLTTEVPA